MNRTQIEWVKNPDGTQGYTWNPITGCLNHTNGLCKGGNFPCYAYRLATTRLKERYLANDNLAGGYCLARGVFSDNMIPPLLDPFYPRFWNNRLLDGRDELCNAKPKGIFPCDMSDLFGIGIPEEWTRKVLEVIESRPQHRFYLLTKQPQNLPQFSPFPANCEVGVTATNGLTYQKAMLWLAQVEAKVKYISFEPLLGRIEFYDKPIVGLNWLIIGAMTGITKQDLWLDAEGRVETPKRYPNLTPLPLGRGKWSLQPRIEWVREIVEAADRAGVAVFLKDNLKPILGDPRENFNLFNHFEPMNPVLRQELPKG